MQERSPSVGQTSGCRGHFVSNEERAQGQNRDGQSSEGNPPAVSPLQGVKYFHHKQHRGDEPDKSSEPGINEQKIDDQDHCVTMQPISDRPSQTEKYGQESGKRSVGHNGGGDESQILGRNKKDYGDYDVAHRYTAKQAALQPKSANRGRKHNGTFQERGAARIPSCDAIDQGVHHKADSQPWGAVLPSENPPQRGPLKLGKAKIPLVGKEDVHRVRIQNAEQIGRAS